MTTTCIYYDLDEISPDDIRRARRRAPASMEFAPAGIVWPHEIGGKPPHVVSSSRDFEYQAELMAWIDRLFGALIDDGDGTAPCPYQDRALLEIGRYSFFFEFAAVEQRWRAFSEIVRTSKPNHLIWVTPRDRIQTLAALKSDALPMRVEFLAASNSSRWGAVLRAAKGFARPPLKRLQRRLLQFAVASHPASSAADTKVVFAEYYPNSAMGLLPVAKALHEESRIEPTWLALRGPVAELLRDSAVLPNTIDQFVNNPGDERIPLALTDRDRFSSLLDRLPEDLFRGTSQLVGRQYLTRALKTHLTAAIEQARYWLAALSSAFSQLRPRCVVSTTYSSIPGRAASVACNRCGGKSVYLQHGLFPDRPYFARFCNDVLLLWGESNRRFMIEQGIVGDRMHVVGASNYDDLIARSRSTVPRPLPRPGEALRVALMASRTAGAALGYSAAQSCLVSVADAVAEIPAARLIVKIHPGDKTGMIDRTVGKRPHCTIVKAGASQDVILESDIIVVVSSTTGLEACVADKPLIVLEPEGVPSFGSYAQYGAALEVHLQRDGDSQRIAEAIELLQCDASVVAGLALGRRRLVDDMLNCGRGDAAILAAHAIATLVSSSDPVGARPLQGV
jgi:hypothetical protein